eukprot:TRINITY_DN89175_c0_g1_i1.p1 TRINITY_DN89175_c0_g1~~TRINITY_DN89175_c0_g1_i1.p1  ORF type:complete len:280 (-),score=37.19 TRINITY_DN89175_c0_g1_i1:156-995(-)
MKAMQEDKGDMPVLTIACCGDSLTETGYPQELQRTLCAECGRNVAWRVLNLGVAGTTARRTSLWYGNSPVFKRALESAADIVTLLLGTNDAHEVWWNEAEFIQCLSEMVRQLQAASSKAGRPEPTILLGVPPPLYHNGHVLSRNLQKNVINVDLPRIIPQLAQRLGVGYFDAFSALGGQRLLKPESVASDGVHLSAVGRRLLANLVAEKVLTYRGVWGPRAYLADDDDEDSEDSASTGSSSSETDDYDKPPVCSRELGPEAKVRTARRSAGSTDGCTIH